MSRRRRQNVVPEAIREKRLCVCAKHGTWSDDEMRFLHTSFAAQYNHCLECAIEAHGPFNIKDTALLVGEEPGNIWQIEHRALVKLVAGIKTAKFKAIAQALLEDHEAPDKAENEFVDKLASG